MTNTLEALAGHVRHSGDAVRLEAWRWATALLTRAEQSGSEEAEELALAVQRGLVADGEYALLDLALAGPAHGGLDDDDVAVLTRRIEERLALQAA
jgi:hypothetical protein